MKRIVIILACVLLNGCKPNEQEMNRNVSQGFFACQKEYGFKVDSDFKGKDQYTNDIKYILYDAESGAEVFCHYDVKTKAVELGRHE